MWKNEKKFINDFLNAGGYTNKPICIIKEFRTGYGLPDILVIEYDKDIIKKRIEKLKRSNPRRFDINCAYAMAYLSGRRWVKLNNFKINSNNHNGSIKKLIENLLERKLIIKKADKIKCLPQKEIFAVKNIMAIEAKLEKWKRAIFQAHRYLWFTNNSNILIPGINMVQLNKIIINCKKYDVGLITFSGDKIISPIIKIKKSKPYNTYLTWVINELLIEEIKDD